jgi:hypothetical protein
VNTRDRVQALLQAFQDGYTRRDLDQVGAFMALFTPDAEVIGTNGIRPGEGEWYRGRESARALVQGDWEAWGDLRVDLENATIRTCGDAGWITAYATIGDNAYTSYLATVRERIDSPGVAPRQLVLDILRGGSNTLFELSRGESFVWPLRLTAVVVRCEDVWRFAQMHFSYATTRFPDVRIAGSG